MTMGEVIEFTTVAKHQRRFYRISSSSISFGIKRERHATRDFQAERPAAIGLAEKPGDICNFWILIKPFQCWIERNGVQISNIKELRNCATNEFTKFWITWYNNRVRFGQTIDGVPLFSKHYADPIKIHYVTFDIFADRGSLHWRLCLPPKIEAPLPKRFTGSELHWVKWCGKLPDDALIGGYGRDLLYIIRAKHLDSLIPGNYCLSDGLAVVPVSHSNHKVEEFEILCGYNCMWVASSSGSTPVGAIEAGYDHVVNETLYIGRALHFGDILIPGKVQQSIGGLCVVYNMSQYHSTHFEVLVNVEPVMNLPRCKDILPGMRSRDHCRVFREYMGCSGLSDEEM